MANNDEPKKCCPGPHVYCGTDGPPSRIVYFDGLDEDAKKIIYYRKEEEEEEEEEEEKPQQEEKKYELKDIVSFFHSEDDFFHVFYQFIGDVSVVRELRDTAFDTLELTRRATNPEVRAHEVIPPNAIHIDGTFYTTLNPKQFVHTLAMLKGTFDAVCKKN